MERMNASTSIRRSRAVPGASRSVKLRSSALIWLMLSSAIATIS